MKTFLPNIRQPPPGCVVANTAFQAFLVLGELHILLILCLFMPLSSSFFGGKLPPLILAYLSFADL